MRRERIAAALEQNLTAMREEAAAAAANLAKLASATGNDMADRARTKFDTVTDDVAEAAKSRVHKVIDGAKGSAVMATNGARGVVARNPFTSALIATGLGLAINQLLRRGRSSRR